MRSPGALGCLVTLDTHDPRQLVAITSRNVCPVNFSSDCAHMIPGRPVGRLRRDPDAAPPARALTGAQSTALALRGRAGAQSSLPGGSTRQQWRETGPSDRGRRKKATIQLLAVDHSARASMKNAASHSPVDSLVPGSKLAARRREDEGATPQEPPSRVQLERRSLGDSRERARHTSRIAAADRTRPPPVRPYDLRSDTAPAGPPPNPLRGPRPESYPRHLIAFQGA
ncbi:hypothetical protein DPEC_G00361420 [Dallia pectoralis]|uniref:Uncharacterized protein n=1 Tax=Dallia pectoralis TaxID=75939 RepID=A0ACC2F1G4_DALPE|nr:hypothetical protein DPEC_G00361420 [Dallia pectoralis]